MSLKFLSGLSLNVVTDVVIKNVLLIISGTVNPKRHEPKSYEAGNSAVGLFLKNLHK